MASGPTASPTPLGNSTPTDVGPGPASAGTSPAASRSDHAHEHGDNLGGTLHSAATTLDAGFLSAADKTKLDGIAPGAPGLSSATPEPVGIAAGGLAALASRADHIHAHDDQLGGTLHSEATPSDAGFMSAADKTTFDDLPNIIINIGNLVGWTTTTNATPEPVGTATAGSGALAAKEDHVHAHGDQLGGTLHAVATQSTAGFQSAADKTKQDNSVADYFLATNNEVGALVVGQVVRVSGESVVLNAFGDTPTNAAGALFVAVAPIAPGASGYFLSMNAPQKWVLFDGVPTSAAMAYLSITTTGKATTTIPPVAVTNQRRRIGFVIATQAGNLGLVSGGAELLSSDADGSA